MHSVFNSGKLSSIMSLKYDFFLLLFYLLLCLHFIPSLHITAFSTMSRILLFQKMFSGQYFISLSSFHMYQVMFLFSVTKLILYCIASLVLVISHHMYQFPYLTSFFLNPIFFMTFTSCFIVSSRS